MIIAKRYDIRRWMWRLVVVGGAVLLATSCSPYASINIGTSFNAGGFYVNPSIGIGGFL